MDNQIILVVDEKGNFTGEYVDKWEAHSGKGIHHKAITILIYNSKGEVLLQRRKHKVHDDVWDFAGSTHQLHKKDGTDETDEEATYRCLESEWGITEKIPLKNLGGINYFASYGELCENEYDVILTGEYSGKLHPNDTHAHHYRWLGKKELLASIKDHPQDYAPWTKEAIKLLQEDNFFD